MVMSLTTLLYRHRLLKACGGDKRARRNCGERTWTVESFLRNSKCQALKRLLTDDHVNIEDTIDIIMLIESISPYDYPDFRRQMGECLCQIIGYRQLIAEVESRRRIQCNSDNLDHDQLLRQLWYCLRPNDRLQGLVSRQWPLIGFQGDDPTTDFRGMGLLALENLVYFVTYYQDTAKALLHNSYHARLGYSLAIVGINLTHLAVQLLQAGHLKSHLYNVTSGRPRLEHFHEVFCYLMVEFDRFWFAERPRDIMEFNKVKAKFHKKIVRQLRNRRSLLTMHS